MVRNEVEKRPRRPSCAQFPKNPNKKQLKQLKKMVESGDYCVDAEKLAEEILKKELGIDEDAPDKDESEG